MKRDLSRAQFEARCAKEGFRRAMLGYWYVLPEDSLMVYAANAGPNRRSQLRYLLQAREKHTRAVAVEG